MNLKIWLDDERKAPEGWVRVWYPIDAINFIKLGGVSELSLDHDLGDIEFTGYDVLLWIEKQLGEGVKLKVPKIKIHTANVSARKKMELAVKKIEEIKNETSDNN